MTNLQVQEQMTQPDGREEDHALMERAGRGEAAAYQQLVRKYLSRSVGFAYRMLGNRADAEDVIQGVFLKLWKEAPGWKPQARFTTWFYRVIVNACIDHRRRRVKTDNEGLEAIADSSPAVDDRMMQDETAGRVLRALQHLPQKQRMALTLSYYEGLRNAQTAEMLGMTLGALQVTLYRAREALKKLLKEQ